MLQRSSNLGHESPLGATFGPAQRPIVPEETEEEDSRAAQFSTQTPRELLKVPKASDLPRSLHLPGSERVPGEAKAFLMP